MKTITCYLDFISPFAYLAFERLPDSLEGISHVIHYKPLLLGALLQHHGQKGPAQVPPKRDWTYRHVQWLGQAHGIPLDMPATHPYNPLPHLRLALATSDDGRISRHVAETIFHDIWRGGADAGDAERLAALAARLSLRHATDSDSVKARLRANTDEAQALGVFGVPSFVVEGKLLWGFDALPMLRDLLQGNSWFDGPGWHEAGQRDSALR